MPGFKIDITDNCPAGPAAEREGPPHTVETARKHRYAITILEPLQNVLLYAYKCTRPVADIDTIVMHNGQDEIPRPGKNRWAPVEFTFYETIDNSRNSAAYYIYQWYADIMLIIEESRHGDVGDYLKEIELQMLDGAGSNVWTYNMFGCWPSKVSPSELSWADSAISDITVTLQVAKARERN